jgi:aminoglycoside 6'-N-acetyltransferase
LIQIVDPANEESHYWGEMDQGLRAIDIWIGEESDMSKGYGTQMMDLALANCFNDSEVKRVLVDPLVANKKAINFFERIGFNFFENKYFDQDQVALYF